MSIDDNDINEWNIDHDDFSELRELSYDVGGMIAQLIKTQSFDMFVASTLQLAATMASYRGKDQLCDHLHEAMKGWVLEMGLSLDVITKPVTPDAEAHADQQVRDFFNRFKEDSTDDHTG